jgi:hypothetical protein
MRRIGIYGWGVVAPRARDVAALAALLRSGETALAPSERAERAGLADGLFPVGEPEFSFDDHAPWIAARHGEAYVARLGKKMGDNVLFCVGATLQALTCDEKLEALARELDERSHVYVGSGVGDLPESYAAARALDRATRAWNRFWADGTRCSARRRYETFGVPPDAAPAPPADPTALPVDSEMRADALAAWDAYWAASSEGLAEFLLRFAEI